MQTTSVRNLLLGVGLGLSGFAGCSADTGSDETPVETVEVAAVACESFTGTIAQHVQAGRVTQFTFFVFIFPVTSYTVVGSNETLGSNPSQSVTLYRQGSGFTTRAEDCGGVCGDGIKNTFEQCDGAPTTTCAEHGFTSGTPRCTATCANDISECRNSTCGDGIVDRDQREECDGSNLDGRVTCADWRTDFSGGNLKCTSGCQYDLSACVRTCGNGVIDGDEQCDGAVRAPQFANLRCQDVDYPDPAFPFLNRVKYPGGTIDCSLDCKLQPLSCTKPAGCFFRTLSTAGPQLYCQ